MTDLTFSDAIEARKVVGDQMGRLNRLPYNRDLSMLAINLCTMVDEYSRIEVAVRRNANSKTAKIALQQQHDALSKAIKHLDQLIMMHQLMS